MIKQEVRKVALLQSDIDLGKPGFPSKCPIALAFGRLYPNCAGKYGSITVGSGKVWVASYDFKDKLGGWCRVFQLPKDVWDWYLNYDKGLPMKPITFDALLVDSEGVK